MIGKARIKVCGITRAADAATALAQGADFLGVNCWPGSPRCVPADARANLRAKHAANHQQTGQHQKDYPFVHHVNS